jgi:hypothetical protein
MLIFNNIEIKLTIIEKEYPMVEIQEILVEIQSEVEV